MVGDDLQDSTIAVARLLFWSRPRNAHVARSASVNAACPRPEDTLEPDTADPARWPSKRRHVTASCDFCRPTAVNSGRNDRPALIIIIEATGDQLVG